MKLIHGLLLSVTMSAALMACNNDRKTDSDGDDDMTTATTTTTTTTEEQVQPGTYVDLNTGKKVYIVRDESTGYATDSIAKVPVEFYVNPSTNDTLYRTGAVVNNMLVQEDGKWKLDETKVKAEGDKLKIKDDSSKVKINGDKSKEKEGDYKKKVNGDQVKIKDGDSKTKIEDGEVKKQKN